MRIINNRAYPGTLIKNFHTLKQMRQHFKRSKKVNKEYWLERIRQFIMAKKKLKSLFGKRRIKNG